VVGSFSLSACVTLSRRCWKNAWACISVSLSRYTDTMAIFPFFAATYSANMRAETAFLSPRSTWEETGPSMFAGFGTEIAMVPSLSSFSLNMITHEFLVST